MILWITMASGEGAENMEVAGPSAAAVARKRMRAATPLREAETTALQAALQEIHQLRQEQRQQRADFEALLQQRDEEIRRVTEQHNQLSRFQIRETPRNDGDREIISENEISFKVKPDIFDGSVPLREYLVQFNLIARANGWSDTLKTVALASNLRGKARSVLDGVFEFEHLSFEELRNKLELRFGEAHLAQTYYTQFTNRKQKSSEDLPSLAADLERLSRLAYPECSHEVRDKIACAQFVSALSDGFLKRTLQLENVSSLKSAVERAMAVKVIQEGCFPRKYENRNFNYGNDRRNGNKFSGNINGHRFNGNFKRNGDNNKNKDNESSSQGNSKAGSNKTGKYFNKNRAQRRECWNCGSTEHFRSECPSLSEENKG